MHNKEQKLKYIKSLKKYQQGDKIKQLRDKHPILDFFAGFIPGVGEVQDAHDFVHAAKKKDMAGMSWALLGLAIPGLAGGQLRKLAKFGDDLASGGIKKIMNEVLPDTLKSKGWKTASDGAFINPQGRRFIRHEGKLTAEDSVKNIKEAASREASQTAAKKAADKQKREIKKAIDGFEDNHIPGFSVREWKTMRKGFKTTSADVAEYESHIPEYYKIFKDLKENGLLKKTKEGWFGNVEGIMVKVNPRQYIIANHPNFINNGWKFDPVNRGTAMFPETGIKIQGNGGLGAANWGTNSNEQLSVFSHQRDDGPTLRGIVSTRNKPDRIVPVKHAHEARMEKYNGITEFDRPVGLVDNDNIKGNWRIYGPDMQIKAIDGNNGLFSKVIKNPLNGIIPPALLGIYYYNNEK